VVVQNQPEDPANKRNKLAKVPDEIGPYISPEEDEVIKAATKKVTGSKSQAKASKKAAAG